MSRSRKAECKPGIRPSFSSPHVLAASCTRLGGAFDPSRFQRSLASPFRIHICAVLVLFLRKAGETNVEGTDVEKKRLCPDGSGSSIDEKYHRAISGETTEAMIDVF